MAKREHSRRAFLGASGVGLAATTLATRSRATRSAEQTSVRERSPEQYVVKLHRTSSSGQKGVSDRLDALLQTIGVSEEVTVERTFERCSAALLEAPPDPLLLDALRQHNAVSSVQSNDGDWGHIPEEPDTTQSARPTQTSQFTPALETLNVPAFWDAYGTRGDGIDVAVADSGIQPDGHAGLEAALDAGSWQEFDENGEPIDSEPYDEAGHGTSVCGLIAGEQTDEGQAYGVAPEVALHVMPTGQSPANFLAAMEYVMATDIDVLSLSLGGLVYNRFQADVFGDVIESGTTIVASIGNAGRYTAVMPACMPTTIGVGGTDSTWPTEWTGGETIRTERYWQSPPAEWPDEYTVPEVVAPGVDVITSEPGGSYGTHGGSSFSTPLVAGVVALVQSATGITDPAELRDLLQETASHPAEDLAFEAVTSPDDRAGAGIPDPVHATAHAGDTIELTGSVVDPDDQPQPGAVVESTFGPRTLTGADGTFSLNLPPREQTLHVSGVGLGESTTTVDPTEDSDVSLTVERVSAPELNLQEPIADHVAPGGEVGAGFLSANIEAVNFEVTVAGLLSPDQLDLFANDTPLTQGEWTSLESPITRGPLSITMSVADDSPIGVVFLTVTVRNTDDDELSGSLNQVHVHDDPWQLPVSDPPVLQEAIEIAAPGTTIEFSGDRRDVTFGEERPAALEIDKPLTLTSAEGSTVTLAFEAPPAPQAPGVDVTANDVTLQNLLLEGTEGTVIRAGQGYQDRESVAPSALTLDGIEVDGGDAGVIADLAPALEIRDTTISETSFAIEDRSETHTTISESLIANNEVGVSITGAGTEIAHTQLQDGNVGILINPDSTVFDPGDELRPVIDGNTFRTLGTGIRISQDVALDIINNQFTEMDAAPIQLDATLHGNVLDNELDDPSIGLLHGDGEVTGEVQGDTQTPSTTPTPTPTDTPSTSPESIPDSSLDLVLYALATGSVGVLFVPYLYRRFRR